MHTLRIEITCHCIHLCIYHSFPQALVIASISLQVANLYGYLRCKAGGQEGQPPDTRCFTGQQFLQRVSDWLLHFSTCSCPINMWKIKSDHKLSDYFFSSSQTSFLEYYEDRFLYLNSHCAPVCVYLNGFVPCACLCFMLLTVHFTRCPWKCLAIMSIKDERISFPLSEISCWLNTISADVFFLIYK